MARVLKPKTQREMLDQLWYAVVGANSEGIAERVKAIDERLHKVEQHLPGCITRDESDAGARHTQNIRVLTIGIIASSLIGVAGVALHLLR